MKTPAIIVCVVLVVGNATAAAAPKIPSGELAGRQRERFVDPPISRFFQPDAQNAPLLTVESDCGPRTAKQKRSKRRQRC
jgi:hypothetical protein